MQSFDTIYIELSSVCNGRCPYCTTGRKKSEKTKLPFMTPSRFESIIDILYEKNIAQSDTVFHLYVWGEPFLNPHFDELLAIASRRTLKVALSTNASIVPPITKNFASCVKSVRFSCCGYLQASYDKIHGFSADKIRENIKTIVDNARAGGSAALFDINFHVYQFNQDEYFLVEKFAEDLGISLSANYAILNDFSMTAAWIKKRMPVDDVYKMSAELFNFIPENLLNNAPEHYKCPQEGLLVLNTKGDICICCQTPHEDKYYSGNIFDDNCIELLFNRLSGAVCQDCVESNMAYIFHNSLIVPQWIKSRSTRSSYDLAKQCYRLVKSCIAGKGRNEN